jgi:atypical dual specificity phosphatase
MPPTGFTWVEKPHLAGLAYPESVDDLKWLRRNGIEILVTLTESPVRRDWVNEAGLMAVNVPVPDMEAPADRQLDHILDTIRKANESGMGVAVHCGAGLGRTGTVLAAWLVTQGKTPRDAIAAVRDMRPGSVETAEQERAVESLARRLKDKPQ